MLSVIPLYGMVRQDFLPSGVDEAQFEMSIVAPEGASVAAMDEAMAAIEAELKQVRGIRTVLTTIAGGPFGTVNEAQIFVAHCAARGARLLADPAREGPRHAAARSKPSRATTRRPT